MCNSICPIPILKKIGYADIYLPNIFLFSWFALGLFILVINFEPIACSSIIIVVTLFALTSDFVELQYFAF